MKFLWFNSFFAHTAALVLPALSVSVIAFMLAVFFMDAQLHLETLMSSNVLLVLPKTQIPVYTRALTADDSSFAL